MQSNDHINRLFKNVISHPTYSKELREIAWMINLGFLESIPRKNLSVKNGHSNQESKYST